MYPGWVRPSLITVHTQKDFSTLNNRTSGKTFTFLCVFLVSLKAAKQDIICFWYQRKSYDQAQLEAQGEMGSLLQGPQACVHVASTAQQAQPNS